MSLLYTDVDYLKHPTGALEVQTRFLYPDGPLQIGDLTQTQRFLEKMDFRSHGSISWEVQRFVRGPITLGLGWTSGGPATVKIVCDNESIETFELLLKKYSGTVMPHTEPIWHGHLAAPGVC
ncbi:MAG: hypothetical protein HN348_32140 [Proteobacteria bacterium]|nr:hypothetical protein [Pseudomonadota bacterium]